MDEMTTSRLKSWISGRGVRAGRVGGLIEDDWDALDRMLGRRSSSEERRFVKLVWDAEQRDYESQSQ